MVRLVLPNALTDIEVNSIRELAASRSISHTVEVMA
jgi:hypothetical protein